MSGNAMDMLNVRYVTDLYADAINRSHAADIANTFTADGIWELTGAYVLKVQGAHAIAEAIIEAQKTLDYVTQIVGSVVVESITGDTAVSRASCAEFGRLKESGRALVSCVFYHDKLVRKSGTWRFQHRLGQLNYWNEYEFKGTFAPFVPLTVR